MQRALIMVEIDKLTTERDAISGKGAAAKKGQVTRKIRALEAERAALLPGSTT